ncbi:CRP/FNR family transcriptional regulator [Tamilnaduibacter salinus]|uniref:Crp/Fnr family transcriptional regulator n=1 Tax=Tamilnaduibacter salinus TaxID=1484056 RepID=A0A2A2I152_9GAMM|nr:fumarate/nitrate reduction transcriptional regulator Fnr [Tamilnaduibacter salinus]PAV24743.1 Crp/Fnr family transcriptional regulator [Tamilnaduibacter salinus]PVY70019.1 CRP/FNR family transcriptional regulator [Tamilnaduibacter salinus]
MGERIPTRHSLALSPSCNHCSLSNLCLPLAVSDGDMGRLDEVVNRGAVYDRGQAIFQQHTPFRSCYAVRSGAIKTSVETAEGDYQITGFYLPGEIIGLDSLHAEEYAGSAIALERSSVCEIPMDQLESLSFEIPTLQHHFFQLMSQEIQNGQQLSLLLSRKTAEERLASLLLSLSSRYERRQMPPTAFRLPMARNDIANFLGLAVETVSRVLTRFQSQGLATINGRSVESLDLEGLHSLLQSPGT